MADYQITCTKKDGADADRRIDALGGPNFKTSPIDDVIRWIDGGHTFWVSVRGRRTEVITAVHHTTRRRYLTTQGDSFPPNNLEALPNCR